MPSKLISRVAFAALFLCSSLFPTWSIVVVNLDTGEVGMAVATCLENVNLRRAVVCLVPEYGISVHQSVGDPDGSQRLEAWELMQLGYASTDIMAALNQGDPMSQIRQIGVATLNGPASTFTGWGCGDWAGGLTGQSGSLVYAIQGNVLTGNPVITEAETAFLNSTGDMAERLIVAMEAAAAMGGDGRCSCSNSQPTSCGSPPPSFLKSSHAFTLMISRPGDPIGDCNSNSCARGEHYCIINITDNGIGDPDAVAVGRTELDLWRASLSGTPDAFRSTTWLSQSSVPSGHATPIQLLVDLRDLNGVPLQSGGASIRLEHDRFSAGGGQLLQVFDHQDGTYTLDLLPNSISGRDILRVVVEDGIHPPVTLWPPVELITEPEAIPEFSERSALVALPPMSLQSSPFLFDNLLDLWFLQKGPNGPSLVEASRTGTQAPFAIQGNVAIQGGQGFQFNDFWVSKDRTRIWLSGKRHGDLESRIWESTRTSAGAPFNTPIPSEELNSGLGEAGPFLSEDELQIWFASKREGTWDIFSANRWSPEGRWGDLTRLAQLDRGGAESAPTLCEGDTRLIFHRDGQEQLHFSNLTPDLGFDTSSILPGPSSPKNSRLIPSSWDASNHCLFLTNASPTVFGSIESFKPTSNSLSLDASTFSQSVGGQLNIQLDAGPNWGASQYQIFIGASGSGSPFLFGETWVPISPDIWTRRVHSNPNLPGLTDFHGTLDAAGQAIASVSMLPGELDISLIGRHILFNFVASQNGDYFLSQQASLQIIP